MIMSSITGNVFIDPYDQATITNYISYYKKDLKPRYQFTEEGAILNLNNTITTNNTAGRFPGGQCIAGDLRTYRLAVGCSNQYAKAATGLGAPTKAQALAKIVTTINRVTGVYELEAGIHFNLVANNNLIVFVAASGDPFNSSNSSPGALITASQTQITNIIGTANFDIGHTFSTGGGGLAGLGVICDASQKARGITGSPSPVGDAYDIDYVAHEIGHQFGGNHTFNAATDNCNGNGTSTANAEPGSGTTIMAYAGICGTNDLQPHSDPQFHAGSLSEIYAHSRNGGGSVCPTVTVTSNTAPMVSAGGDYVIPINTPFILSGSATDGEGDALVYSWEQMNVGGTFGNWNASQSGKIPLFRSFPPVVDSFRYFPQLSDVLFSQTTIGERLPSLTRFMNFRLTVRDNKAGSGGTCFDDMVVTVNSTGGAFSVTYPTAGGVLWYEGQTKTITWNKASTTSSPFNVANVMIELSTDGGATYPIVLKASTPNDGSEDIVVPSEFSFQARIRVRPVGNIFYDVSRADFTIAPNPVPVKWISLVGTKEKNNTVKLNWLVNEIDNHTYQIERSLDGERFSKIGEVPASTQNGNEHSYSFTDARPFASKNYYRIKQIDKNGGYSYSKIISVIIEDATNSWVVYPNPVVDKVNLFANANYNNMKIGVYDAVGRNVYLQTKARVLKGEIVTVALSNLPKGIYSIKLDADNSETLTKKIIVQ